MNRFARLSFLLILLVTSGALRAQTTFWQATNGPPGEGVTGLVVTEGGVLFAGTNLAGIYRSTDNGAQWLPSNTGLSNYYIRALARDASGTLYLGTQGDGVFKSTDGGESWFALGMPTLWTIRALAVNALGHVFAGTSGGGVFRSTDSGVVWTQTNVGLFDPFVRVFAFNSSGHIFVGTGQSGIFRSTNNGESWSVTALSVEWDFRSVTINSQDVVFAGGWGNGVFRSTDSGASWGQVNNGLTSTVVEALAVNSSGHLFAATKTGGVFRSLNNGGQWLAVNEGLTDLDTRVLAVNQAGYLFVGTGSSGVFRTSYSTTAVKTNGVRPARTHLFQNHPNPFNPRTKIVYRVRSREFIELRIFDVLGRGVATLVNEVKEAGTHEVTWDAAGKSSGVYTYRLQAGDVMESKKLVLLK